MAPEGWTVSPAAREVAFRYEGESDRRAGSSVHAAGRRAAGNRDAASAVASRAGRDYAKASRSSRTSTCRTGPSSRDGDRQRSSPWT